MSESEVLSKIVASRRKCIERAKANQALDQNQPVSRRSLYEALKQPGLQFIMECKKASPSRGLIRENFNLEEILTVYNRYASAISVLTEPEYFQGSDEDLARVAKLTGLPVLCKDFIVDPYQVVNARRYSADAILLMLSVLDDESYRKLAGIAKAYAMDVLTEVHTEEELQRALALDAQIIGINNRDLKTLKINLNTTLKLTDKIGKDVLVVSESGISHVRQINRIRTKVKGVLVGSSLMAAPDLDIQCRQLKFGEVKVCGFTAPEAAIQAYESGASYGGLIFHEGSPRGIDLARAQLIRAASPLRYVGVFVKQSPKEIMDFVDKLKLDVVQLHGQQDLKFIQELRAQLDPHVKIWSAQAPSIAKDEQTISLLLSTCDKILFDTKTDSHFGGSGQAFDWSIVAHLNEDKVDIDRFGLAGGLSPENIAEARRAFSGLLDVNSGVESAPGVKDSGLIKQLFKNLGEL